ncbi:hypothetical protein C5167_001067 [Papaver somniferum]|uniref:Uncharacterized protein n=1 Tax=Papaver somniferum TaxID=3469 RepID=A0A4Y7KVQ5_PAPSO|nr:hypothetical protein C5167_001067 [Papaver somniferum]
MDTTQIWEALVEALRGMLSNRKELLTLSRFDLKYSRYLYRFGCGCNGCEEQTEDFDSHWNKITICYWKEHRKYTIKNTSSLPTILS